jgi:hypothetical protein
VWSPQTKAELIAALPHVSESAELEFKEALPAPGKNEDIAVDIAAMTTDGGAIVYGVAEDKAQGTFSPSPITLAGAVERITNVVRASVAGSPPFDAFVLDPGDTDGYVVVSVPASMNAPHQVTSKGQFRFYGRGPGGNVILTQGDIDRLYLRRNRWEESGSQFLDEAVAATSEAFPESPDRLGWLQVAIKPLIGPDDVLERALPAKSAEELAELIREVSGEVAFSSPWYGSLMNIAHERFAPTMDGISITDGASQFLEVRDDGEIRFALRGIANDWNSRVGAESVWIIRDGAVARLLTELFVLANRMYVRAGYHGPVNVGFLLSKAEGSVSASWFEGIRARPPMGAPPLSGELRRIDQVLVAQLHADQVRPIVRKLIAPLLRVLRSPGPHPLD